MGCARCHVILSPRVNGDLSRGLRSPGDLYAWGMDTWHDMDPQRKRIAKVVLVVLGVILFSRGCVEILPGSDDPAPRAQCTEFEGYAWAGDSCAARERAACRDAWDVGLTPSSCERYR